MKGSSFGTCEKVSSHLIGQPFSSLLSLKGAPSIHTRFPYVFKKMATFEDLQDQPFLVKIYSSTLNFLEKTRVSQWKEEKEFSKIFSLGTEKFLFEMFDLLLRFDGYEFLAHSLFLLKK
jgi:hypothetical protein